MVESCVWTYKKLQKLRLSKINIPSSQVKSTNNERLPQEPFGLWDSLVSIVRTLDI